jgi:DHA1 family bicyclomycin/chloramphenicol resistance-like MFS transporter
MGLAPILAPLLGGAVLLHLGWRGIFLVLSVFGVSCLAIIWVGLAESHDTRHEPPLRVAKVICNYLGLLRNHGYLGYALGGGLAMSGMFAYIAGSPFVLIRLFGVEPQHYGLFFGANAFGLIASSQINAHLLRTTAATVILRRALQVPPVVGIVLVAASFSGHLSLWLVAGAFFCFVASLGFIIPNATAAALASHGQQAGTAAALASALQFGCATLAGALVGVFRDATARPLVIVMALCGIGAWASHALLTRRAHVLVEMAHSRDSRSS